jgi:hypothetical protein
VKWEDWPVKETVRRRRAVLDHITWTLLGFVLGAGILGIMWGAGVSALPIFLVGMLAVGAFIFTLLLRRIELGAVQASTRSNAMPRHRSARPRMARLPGLDGSPRAKCRA